MPKITEQAANILKAIDPEAFVYLKENEDGEIEFSMQSAIEANDNRAIDTVETMKMGMSELVEEQLVPNKNIVAVLKNVFVVSVGAVLATVAIVATVAGTLGKNWFIDLPAAALTALFGRVKED